MPVISKKDIDKAVRKAATSNVDLATELKLTAEEKHLFEQAAKAVEALKTNPRLYELSRAFGFGCGGVTC